MISLIVLALVAAAVFGGFYRWAQRQGLLAAKAAEDQQERAEPAADQPSPRDLPKAA